MYAGLGFGRGLKLTAKGGGDPLSARASARGTSSSLSSLPALRFFAARLPLAPFPPREDDALLPRVDFVPVAALAPLLVFRFFAGASLYSSSDCDLRSPLFEVVPDDSDDCARARSFLKSETTCWSRLLA